MELSYNYSMIHQNYYSDIIHRISSRSIAIDTGCIEYRPGSLVHKYGLVSITVDGKRKNVPAHRAMYMAVNKCLELPRNILICHKCDNTRCVNMDHLFAGTPKDNMQDMLAKGRRAENHRQHTRQRKFTDEQIKEIRNCNWKIKHIADRYGVSAGYVSKLKRGKAKALVV